MAKPSANQEQQLDHSTLCARSEFQGDDAVDHVLAKLDEEKRIRQSLGEQRAYAEYCRIEVEYALSFVLGYLWNKNIFDTNPLDDDDCETIFNNITRPSIGTIVDICRRLDLR